MHGARFVVSEEKLLSDSMLVEAREASDEDLLVVHTRRYLNELKITRKRLKPGSRESEVCEALARSLALGCSGFPGPGHAWSQPTAHSPAAGSGGHACQSPEGEGGGRERPEQSGARLEPVPG
eukprot:bmy_18526T0